MSELYQYGRDESSRYYTNLDIFTYCQTGNKQRMKNVRSNNIEKIRIMRGLTREELATKLDTTATTIYRKERGDRQLRLEELQDYARALECTTEELVSDSKKVQVVGYVGAGARVFPIDDHAQGNGFELVDAPTGISDPSICALYVRGDSQEPQLEDGWIIFYRKRAEGVPADCIGRLCVSELPTGEVMVKKVRQGSKPGLYHLISKNADPLLDTKLVWASRVIDIRPT